MLGRIQIQYCSHVRWTVLRIFGLVDHWQCLPIFRNIQVDCELVVYLNKEKLLALVVWFIKVV